MLSKKRKKGKISVYNSNSSSSPSSSPSVVIASNINLLSQILLRLPLKYLLIFKSVSKQWLSLIQEPYFNHKYCLQNPHLSVQGLYWNETDLGEDRQEPVYEYINLKGDENGRYVPFKSIALDDRFVLANDSKKCIYYIFDPFTKKYSILPKSILRKGGFTFAGNVNLVYDSLRSPYYKVICLWDVKERDFKKRIEVYSSETKSWKLCGCGNEYILPNLIGKFSGVSWNGMLNWLACGDQSLVYFDIDREVIGEVPRPLQELDYQRYFRKYRINNFDEYGGHLFCVEVSLKICSHLDIMEMDTDYTGWSVKYKVDLQGPVVSDPIFGYIRGYNLISFHEEVEDSPRLILLIHDRKMVISYDLKNANFQELFHVAAPRHYAMEGCLYLKIFPGTKHDDFGDDEENRV
ncbi:F-box protein At5g07610-like [Papaver somniferum]|uniref:F-box protein At5g07610-like n=1 Tax=Papaver somniferum TaxID=3469 RepID=UPI000E6F8DCB|nr:F-box protein At5g07610-like [Papaver somniferum]